MYLTAESIRNLNDIISGLNGIENEQERAQFMDKHIEDTALFIETLKKLNKKKLPGKNAKIKKPKAGEAATALYKEEEIYDILCEKSNEEIMSAYLLSDLKRMYESVYNRKPASNYTKERIIITLRNRMHTMKRAEAFALMEQGRNEEKATLLR